MMLSDTATQDLFLVLRHAATRHVRGMATLPPEHGWRCECSGCQVYTPLAKPAAAALLTALDVAEAQLRACQLQRDAHLLDRNTAEARVAETPETVERVALAMFRVSGWHEKRWDTQHEDWLNLARAALRARGEA